ncbi:MAG: cell division topological specificity factor MinE [Candidatus Eremiobacter antarcticus]|nr:cell division topological specificity factor MinE [Candidatus Eremiobacteraeota bacterium]MBC5808140.1 cell division topological specificity factor MinE [Candidatus Eremiobacteraeota bacterium]PZR63537.1 MAG: cell division topological specificity factor MinE [Candidatus Eremiobacter sp. RRmetagenome_bin22]
MLDFLTKFFRRDEPSKSLAKDRLRFVLMSDRISLAPETFDAMKGEMLSVLQRYLEIDERGLDVHFENAERRFMLLANIPVNNVKTLDQIRSEGAVERMPSAVQTEVAVEPPAHADEPARSRVSPPDETARIGRTNGANVPSRRRRRRRSPRNGPNGQPVASFDNVTAAAKSAERFDEAGASEAAPFEGVRNGESPPLGDVERADGRPAEDPPH